VDAVEEEVGVVFKDNSLVMLEIKGVTHIYERYNQKRGLFQYDSIFDDTTQRVANLSLCIVHKGTVKIFKLVRFSRIQS
jgi:hypothetical protein